MDTPIHASQLDYLCCTTIHTLNASHNFHHYFYDNTVFLWYPVSSTRQRSGYRRFRRHTLSYTSKLQDLNPLQAK